MSLASIPSLPEMPSEMLCACDQADVLREVCISGPMLLGEAARALKISRARALDLKALWGASTDLRELIRQHLISPEAAAVLARIESVSPMAAIRMTAEYVRRHKTTGDLRRELHELRRSNATTRDAEDPGKGNTQ